jgi:hypothetical protein
MEIIGKIIHALPEQSGTSAKSGKQWRKREYVLEMPGQYPRRCAFQVMGDNIEKLNIQEGAEYEISVDFDASEYKGKWYNSIIAWRATRRETVQPGVQSLQTPAPITPTPQPQTQATSDDGLPF